ncbi:MAG TPA: hypothetical protein VM184_10295 [Gaiellaceae bacterium]|nr:hypothetical protein [Gaiellaceae bacterium]
MATSGRPLDPPALAGTVARATVWLAVGVAVTQTAVGAANELTVESSALNPDVEGSIFQLLSAAVTAAAAAAAAIHAWLVRERRFRFVTLAAILAAFTADDLLAVHERGGDAVGGTLLGLPDHLAVRLWIVLLLPLLVVLFLILAGEAVRAAGRVGWVLGAGLAALVAAVGVELVGAISRSPSVVARIGGKPEAVRLLVEEGLEIGGLVLVAGGLWSLVAAVLPVRQSQASSDGAAAHDVEPDPDPTVGGA